MDVFIAAVALSYPFWGAFTGRGLALAAIFGVVLFCSILIHELAHAVVAQRYRVPVDGITIYLLGGYVQFGAHPRTAWQHGLIITAGPFSNLVLAGIAFGLLSLLPATEPQMVVIGGKLVPGMFEPPGMIERALRAAAYLNLGLFALNMLPAFPLDGGRLLYLLLSRRIPDRTAAVIVGALGMACAVLSGVVFLVSLIAGVPILALVSFTLNQSVVQSARHGQHDWREIAA